MLSERCCLIVISLSLSMTAIAQFEEGPLLPRKASLGAQLAKKNMASAWLKTNTKVLALWGSTDFISTQWDHEYIANILNQKTPNSAEYLVVPNSDHGFSTVTTMKESMEKWGPGKAAFNPNIVEILRA